MFFKDKNYFELFSIPASFQVDTRELTDSYRQLQSRFHPDRVAGGSEQERLRSVQATSLLNEAYETLKSPQKRAAYLLSLRGVDVEQVSQDDLSPDLLMEQIELREQLEELPRDESALDTLETLRERVTSRQEQGQQKFADALTAEDLETARKNYYEMQYFAKLSTEIESLEEDLLGY